MGTFIFFDKNKDECPHFYPVLGKPIGARGRIPAHGPRGQHIAAGRTAQTQIDTARIKRFQGAELFGDDQRRMVREHHATRANAYLARHPRDVADYHRRRGTGDTGHIVVLGKPVALIAAVFSTLRQVHRVAKGLRRIAARENWGEIEHRERNHEVKLHERQVA